MNEIRKIQQLSKRELEQGVSDSASWHSQYSDSSYIFIGGLPFELKEEDIITIFSQYGTPVAIKLVRDRETGESKGFCFLEYENQRSTVLLVDNFNGIKLVGRTIKVDHCYYKPFTSDDPEQMEKEKEYEEKMKKLLFEESEPKEQGLLEDTKQEEPVDAEDDELADPMAKFLTSKKVSKSDLRKESRSSDRDHHSHHHSHHHRHHHHSRHSGPDRPSNESRKDRSPERKDIHYKSDRS